MKTFSFALWCAPTQQRINLRVHGNIYTEEDGWHYGGHRFAGLALAWFSGEHANLRVIPATRSSLHSAEELDALVSECDVIVHLAGMNRGDDQEVEATNVALAEALVAACTRTGSVIYSNSMHCTQDSAYGRSKRCAARKLQQWAEDAGAIFTDVLLASGPERSCTKYLSARRRLIARSRMTGTM